MKIKKKLTRKQRAILQSNAAKNKIPTIKVDTGDEVVLGTISGTFDTQIETVSKVDTPLEDAGDVLQLPQNALVAMRRSGGFVFRSDEVVAYADGKVTHRDSGFGSVAKPAEVGTLTEAQLAQINKALAPDTFTAFEATMAPVPDSYVVELAAQVGPEVKCGEVAELFATEPARSIIRLLTMFIPL
jgi:hypothetical protein